MYYVRATKVRLSLSCFYTTRKRNLLTEALALVGGSVNEDFGADDVSKGEEHLHQFSVSKLLREVIDEEVASLGARDGTACKGNQ